MAIDLSSVQVKIDRAATHLKALDSLVGAGVEVDAELRTEFDPQRQAHRARFIGVRRPNLDSVTAVLGDFVHNTRSALDHWVSAALWSNGRKVKRHHAFPICWGEQAFRRQVLERDPADGPSCVDGLTPEQIQIVRDHQPYVGRNPSEARRAPLFLLDWAWNVDKHRRVHAGVMSMAGVAAITLADSPYFGLADVEPTVGAGALLKPNTDVAFVRVGVRRPHPPEAQPDVKADLPVAIAFHGQGGIRFAMPDRTY